MKFINNAGSGRITSVRKADYKEAGRIELSIFIKYVSMREATVLIAFDIILSDLNDL